MNNNYHQKHKEGIEKEQGKCIRTFLKKKRTKGKKCLRKISKYF